MQLTKRVWSSDGPEVTLLSYHVNAGAVSQATPSALPEKGVACETSCANAESGPGRLRQTPTVDRSCKYIIRITSQRLPEEVTVSYIS